MPLQNANALNLNDDFFGLMLDQRLAVLVTETLVKVVTFGTYGRRANSRIPPSRILTGTGISSTSCRVDFAPSAAESGSASASIIHPGFEARGPAINGAAICNVGR